MFYRRKIILALLEKFENGLERTRLQKLVFLISQRQNEPNYEFVPYKFGCYSYSLKADIDAMIKRGIINNTDNTYNPKEAKNYYNTLKGKDKLVLDEVVSTYGKMKTDTLIKHTYLNFPYHAINSEIATTLLPEKYLIRIEDNRPKDNKTTLFTIGYEGISLEAYLNKLIQNNIKLLVDVRKNPLSMKFGFSKTLLKRYCGNLGIEYIHIPEVGIDSSKRQELNTQSDYDILFDDYKKTVLKSTDDNQKQIMSLLKKYKRIALTCFEADKCQCHRFHLANNLKDYANFKYEVAHI
ncbi:DUF488 domain-containing protein [Oceanihabitans sp. IOP_32]|uniref:DUF488 domain-containing protein n=1 Tax=Oceanihabitans sp. IOP_32 TaxID=2529032 RepID=UPI001293AABB|nr:DUF488 domain-containing protein [Oceanihabitans sp. IOP_32]QFZ54499.1 DUF488 domain-containing protein [Oceanihabitans sp. IOP_32]